MKKLTKQERESVKSMYDGHCAYCGNELGNRWHVDHVEPVVRKSELVKVERSWKFVPTGDSYYPENDCIENMKPACQPCNLNKGGYSLEGWRKALEHYQETLLRDSSTARHLNRFGLLEIKRRPVVFYFERVKK